MIIEKVKLINFRNYKSYEQEFIPGINLILGENAVGKTNLLESVYVLANTKSYKTRHDSKLITFDTQGFYLKGDFKIKSVSNISEIAYFNKNKIIKFNNEKIKKIRDFIAKILIVLYNPFDIYIVNEGPKYRRTFVNIILSKTDVDYYVSLKKYYHILHQKKIGLTQFKERKLKFDFLEVLNYQLIDLSAEILFKRMNFIKKFKSIVVQKFCSLMGRKYNFTINYKTDCLVDIEAYIKNDIVFDELYDSVKQKYHKVFSKEIKFGRCLVGIHKDDFIFKLNNKPVKFYSSQGERKSLVLSLKLSEVEYIRNKTGMYPIVLLDDLFSELDEIRQEFLLKEIVNKYQIIITDTYYNKKFDNIININKIKLKF